MDEFRTIEVSQARADIVSAPPLVGLPDGGVSVLSAEPFAITTRDVRRDWLLTRIGVDGATLGAAAIAAMVDAHDGALHWTFSLWTMLFCLLTVVFFHGRGLYRRRIHNSALEEVRQIVAAVSVAAMCVMALRLVVDPLNAIQMVRPWVFALIYVTGGRLALDWSRARTHASGEAMLPTLVIGTGRVGRAVLIRLQAQPRLGLRPIGFVDDTPGDELELPCLGGFDELEDVVQARGVKHVIVAFSEARDEVVLDLVNRAEALGTTVSIVPRLFEKMSERLTVEHLGALPLVTPHPANPRGLTMAAKYAFDRVTGAVLIVLTSPLLLISAVAVYCSLGRPILFRQVRVGRDGKTFDILKFRSMKLPTLEELELQATAMAEELPGGVEGVDRRTRVGTLLRQTSLDELPQLFNVLRGEMSIVGPRPERPEFVSKFEQSVYRYGARHRVKSGITGWAQVHGLRGKSSIDDRAEWDNFYVENFSLWLDVKILFMTFAAVLSSFKHVE